VAKARRRAFFHGGLTSQRWTGFLIGRVDVDADIPSVGVDA
jgi:hypothetical protein